MSSVLGNLAGVADSDKAAPLLDYDVVVRSLAKTHADTPLISYPSPDYDSYTTLTGTSLERLTRAAALRYVGPLEAANPQRCCRKNRLSEHVVVSLVGPSTLEYLITFLAMHRLGFSTIQISPRLADEGFAHLLRETNSVAVIAAPGTHLAQMKQVRENHGTEAVVVPMLSMEDIEADRPTEDLPVAGEGVEAPGLYMHTGGTTGLPKVVRSRASDWLGSAFLTDIAPPQGGLLPALPSMTGEKLTETLWARVGGLLTVPLFHTFGLASISRSLREGSYLVMLNGLRAVTAERIIKALDDSGCNRMSTVPYVLRFLTEAPGAVERLAKLDSIVVGGSATPEDVARTLIRNGVKLHMGYGQTESGLIMTMDRQLADQMGIEYEANWGYMAVFSDALPHVEFEKLEGDAGWGKEGQGSQDVYQLIIKPSLPSLKMHDRPDGSYATKDLFVKHPTVPNLWKFLARHDDIIVMVNGEKADPHPMEMAVAKNPNVDVAVAFGSGRDALGMIVIASEKAAALSKDEVLKSILPYLEEGNARASAWARISPDCVLVKPFGTRYPMTDKSTLIRPQFLKMFSDDIEAHYAAREQSAQATGEVMLEDLSETGIRNAVRNIVRTQLRLETLSGDGEEDDVDFFSMGMDSLQATNVRAKIQRTIPLNSKVLKTNVIFDNPTINALTQHIVGMRSGVEDGQQSYERFALQLAKKYSKFDPIQQGNKTPGAGGHTVLLTGATGFIGKHILHSLLTLPDTTSVICLVRGASHDAARERLMSALGDARILPELSPSHVAKLAVLASDISQPSLGLSESELLVLRGTVTHIIHNAWPVNFNMALQSFERPGVAATHHLLQLALSSLLIAKPTFTFVSSVGAIMRARPLPIKEVRHPITAAAAMGYGLSKWIGEEICDAAVQAAREQGVDFTCRALRVAQVCGDTQHGRWNPAEAIPNMVRTAVTIGALPLMGKESAEDDMLWLPVDVTGRAIVELAMAHAQAGRASGDVPDGVDIYHVANSKSMSWNDDFLPVLEKHGLQFEAVPKEEWLRRLEASDKDAEKNPPIRLLEHWRGRYAAGGVSEARPDLMLDMSKAKTWAPSLVGVEPVDAELMAKCLRYWREEAWA